MAVGRIWTWESGSSIQSTGTSLIRSPSRSAVMRSSVSKNHSSSSTKGRIRRAASRRNALKPTLGVTESTTQEQLEEEVVGARHELAVGPRITWEPWARRVPAATSRCPERRGATSGTRAVSEVDKSTSM